MFADRRSYKRFRDEVAKFFEKCLAKFFSDSSRKIHNRSVPRLGLKELTHGTGHHGEMATDTELFIS